MKKPRVQCPAHGKYPNCHECKHSKSHVYRSDPGSGLFGGTGCDSCLDCCPECRPVAEVKALDEKKRLAYSAKIGVNRHAGQYSIDPLKHSKQILHVSKMTASRWRSTLAEYWRVQKEIERQSDKEMGK